MLDRPAVEEWIGVTSQARDDPLGAYGLRLEGLSRVADLLVPASADWPVVSVRLRRGATTGVREEIGENQATIVFRDVIGTVRRVPPTIVFTFAEQPAIEGVLHPYLSPAASLLAHWAGRECLHAGAFAHDDGAWGVVAERDGGKSTTLARLALEGVPIVADDLLVIEGGSVFAGPRAIDLRADPARRLGVGEALGVLGTRARWRLRISPVAASLPLRGWVFLEWGPSLSATPVAAGPRLERLARQRMIRLRPIEPLALLRLAALPAVVVRRPRSWESLEGTTRLLLDSLPT